jgi:hypothetical protein
LDDDDADTEEDAVPVDCESRDDESSGHSCEEDSTSPRGRAAAEVGHRSIKCLTKDVGAA